MNENVQVKVFIGVILLTFVGALSYKENFSLKAKDVKYQNVIDEAKELRANALIDQFNEQELEKERCRYLISNIQWQQQDGSRDWYIIENNKVIYIYSGYSFPQNYPHDCSYQQKGVINQNYQYRQRYTNGTSRIITTYSTFENGRLVIYKKNLEGQGKVKKKMYKPFSGHFKGWRTKN